MLLTDVLVPFSTLSQTFHFFWPRKKDIILLLFSDIGVVKKFLHVYVQQKLLNFSAPFREDSKLSGIRVLRTLSNRLGDFFQRVSISLSFS